MGIIGSHVDLTSAWRGHQANMQGQETEAAGRESRRDQGEGSGVDGGSAAALLNSSLCSGMASGLAISLSFDTSLRDEPAAAQRRPSALNVAYRHDPSCGRGLP